LPCFASINRILPILNRLDLYGIRGCSFNDRCRYCCVWILCRTRISSCISRSGNNIIALNIRMRNSLNDFILCIGPESYKRKSFLPSPSVIDGILTIINWLNFNAGLCCICYNWWLERINLWFSFCWSRIRNDVLSFVIWIRNSLDDIIFCVGF